MDTAVPPGARCSAALGPMSTAFATYTSRRRSQHHLEGKMFDQNEYVYVPTAETSACMLLCRCADDTEPQSQKLGKEEPLL